LSVCFFRLIVNVLQTFFCQVTCHALKRCWHFWTRLCSFEFFFEHVHLILLTKATWVASSWSPDHFLPFKCLMHSLFLTYTHENSGICSENSLSTCFSIGYSSVKVKKHYRF
jgi:hypothetical protein